MDKRQQFINEINAACDQLKDAGFPHARDLAKHIIRMKHELKFYDKCMRMGGIQNGSKQSRNESGYLGNNVG